VDLPAAKPCDFAYVLKVAGAGLKPVKVAVVPEPIRPDAQGNLTLPADAAEVQGAKLAVEERGGRPNLGFWDDAAEYASWTVSFPSAGTYEVTGSIAAAIGESALVIEIPGQQVAAKIAKTRSWDDFRSARLGKLQVAQGGTLVLKARPRDAASWKAINLRSLRLTRAPGAAPK